MDERQRPRLHTVILKTFILRLSKRHMTTRNRERETSGFRVRKDGESRDLLRERECSN